MSDGVEMIDLKQVCEPADTSYIDVQSMKRDIQKSENIKKRLDEYLDSSQYTQVVKKKDMFKSEVEECKRVTKDIERSLIRGNKLMNDRNNELRKAKDALGCIIEDIIKNHITSLDSNENKLFTRQEAAQEIREKDAKNNITVLEKNTHQIEAKPKEPAHKNQGI